MLRYLRVNDEPSEQRHDLALTLPVQIDNLSQWFPFCADIAKEKLWQFELLTIDFNFQEDRSGPSFPKMAQELRPPEFKEDDLLRELKWSNGLFRIGPNSRKRSSSLN